MTRSAEPREPARPRVARFVAFLRTPLNRAWTNLVPEWSLIVRITIAAIVSYVLNQALVPGNEDLTGPLTAVLVVQTSLYATLRMGLERMGAVLLGIGVAIVLSTWAGLSWWSLGLVIFVALLSGSAFGFGDHKLEVPISAMLILGVTQHGVAAEVRLVNSAVGAIVGVALTVLFPPRVATPDAAAAVRRVAGQTAEVARRAGVELADAVSTARFRGWIDAVHQVLPLVGDAGEAIDAAEASRVLNPRVMATVNTVPVLRAGLESLDRALLAIRQVLLAMRESAAEHPEATGAAGASGAVGAAGANPGSGVPDPQLEIDADEAELRGVFSVVLLDIADCVEAFGELVVAEASGSQALAEDRLGEALEILRETRARLTDLALVSPADDRARWLVRGSIVAGIAGVLDELDLEAHALTRDQFIAASLARAQKRVSFVNPWGIRVIDPLVEFFTDEDAGPFASGRSPRSAPWTNRPWTNRPWDRRWSLRRSWPTRWRSRPRP